MKVPLAFITLVGLYLSAHGAPPVSYKETVLADKPFAYYRLDELANTESVVDAIGNNIGVYVNAPKVGVPGAIATDRKSTAVSFARKDQQYIKLTELGSFGSGLSSGFTVEYWLKTADSTDRQMIFRTDNGQNSITIFLADIAYEGKAKRLRLYCRDDHLNRFEANFYPEGNNIDIFDDRWHYIVHVYNPNAANLDDKILLYVDGFRQTLKAVQKGGVPKFSDFTNPLILGAKDAPWSKENYLEGSLDEVAFYLGPLTEAQIISHYSAAGRGSEEQLQKQGRAQSRFHGFPVAPPVEDADPAIRHNEIINFPTKLLFGRREGVLTVAVDKRGTKPVQISVGSKMIVGVRDRLFIYPAGKARPEKPGCYGLIGGTDLTNSETSLDFLLRADGDPVVGSQYIVELAVEVFETDVPAQHMWSPEGDKFKVLYSDTLRDIVTPAPQPNKP